MDSTFCKVEQVTANFNVARYTSGLTLYEEALVDSRWINRHSSPIGKIVSDPLVRGELLNNSAFALEIDGASLHSGWQWVGFEKLPAEREGQEHCAVNLRHDLRQIELAVHTIIDGSAVMMRWLEITNASGAPAALSKLSVWHGRALPLQARDSCYGPAGFQTVRRLYELGYFIDNGHSQEGHFQWRTLDKQTVEIGEDGGKSGWGHPIAYLRDAEAGHMMVIQLAWSGNWRMQFKPVDGVLFTSVGPYAAPPMRIIAPGETITSPRVHFGCVCGDITEMVQELHTHQRRSVIVPPPKGSANLISYNHWSYITHEMDEQRLLREIDIAADVGAEVFTVDAGWYGDEGVDWGKVTGDWRPGGRLPNGLKPVFDYARSKGLKCGLWVWIEAASQGSKIIAEHPDWLLHRDGKPLNHLLDLAKPEVAEWVESEIARIVTEYEIDLFRLDYNASPGEGGYNLRHGHMENTIRRHYEAFYGIWQRTRERFPNLILENCAGGGGRTDLGMMSQMHFTWFSDYCLAPRTIRMQNGMLLALAPELLARAYGMIMNAHLGGDVDMQLRMNFMLGNPCLSGLWPKAEDANPLVRDKIRNAVEFFKTHVRPMINQCRVFHHTPEIRGQEPGGWCVLEYALPDASKAIVGAFRLAGEADSRRTIKLRGVSREKNYTLWMDNSRERIEITGRELADSGVTVNLMNPMTSELLLIEQV